MKEEIIRAAKKQYTKLLQQINTDSFPTIKELDEARDKWMEAKNIQWIDKVSEHVPDPLVNFGGGKLKRLSEL